MPPDKAPTPKGDMRHVARALRRALVLTLLVVAASVFATPANAAGDPDVAALQVALRAHGLYGGPIDGVSSPASSLAVRTLQRRARLPVDGVVGPRTRAALGGYGGPPLGGRVLAVGAIGWDVAALQFLLARHGFPSGNFDATFGARTVKAVRRFQRWAGLPAVGVVGPATLDALRAAPPHTHTRLARPAAASLSGLFGPRGARFHAGVDFAEVAGAPVRAAASGQVVYAGWHPGGWGYLVALAHGRGLRTMYAHLSYVNVRLGQLVRVGAEIGHVGSTGRSTGPHLHFEARLRGAAIDPVPVFG